MLDSVNFGCFVLSRCECLHCNAMGKCIKASMNGQIIQQNEQTAKGGGCPCMVWSNTSWVMVTWDPHLFTDRHDRKHYLPAALLADGNNYRAQLNLCNCNQSRAIYVSTCVHIISNF